MGKPSAPVVNNRTTERSPDSCVRPAPSADTARLAPISITPLHAWPAEATGNFPDSSVAGELRRYLLDPWEKESDVKGREKR